MKEEQIFHEVLEQAADKRAAFLAAACGADGDLRQRVEVLRRSSMPTRRESSTATSSRPT